MRRKFCILHSSSSTYSMWSPAYKLHLKYFVKLRSSRLKANLCSWFFLRAAELGSLVSQVYSNPTREVGMILELLKDIMTGLHLSKKMMITMKDWLKQALFMLARKTRVKNVTHYRNDCNYEFQPLLQLSLWKKSGPQGCCTFYAIGRITFCLRTPLVHFSTAPLAAYLRCSPPLWASSCFISVCFAWGSQVPHMPAQETEFVSKSNVSREGQI